MFFKSVASCMFINKYKSLWAAKLDLTGKKKEEEEGGEGGGEGGGRGGGGVGGGGGGSNKCE